MKRIKGVLTACCVCIVCLLLLTACSAKLSAPTSFRLDEATLMLSWNQVKTANAYTVEIGDSISVTTRETSYPLDGLAPGEYVIRIRAISYSKDIENSDYAEYKFVREEESGLKYKLNATRDSYTLVGVGDASGDVVMEDYYRGKPVTAINKAALRRCNKITSFVVGENVTTIGDNAFYACGELISVTFPEGLESIGEGAFQSCAKLENVILPEKITEVKPYTFSMCKGLKTVSIGASVTNIAKYAFSDCIELQRVELSDAVRVVDEYGFSGCTALNEVIFGKNLQTIGQYAFYGCTGLGVLNLSEGLVNIDMGAFMESGVTSVVMPANVTTIGAAAFANCANLNNVVLNDNLESIGYYAFINTGLMNNCKDPLFVIGDWVILAMDNTLEDYDIPANIVGVAGRAFSNCANLKRVNLPNVKYIGTESFASCSQLWEVICGDSLLQIDMYGFAGCRLLTDVILGQSVQRIANYAFVDCERLEDSGILLPKSLMELGTGVFNGTRLYFSTPTSVIYVDDWVVGVQEGVQLKNTYLAAGTRGICNYGLMYGAYVDGQMYLPDSLEIIGKGAFYKNPYLVTVNIPSSVKYIGDYAFANTSAVFSDVGTLEIPEGCTYVGDYAFRNCQNLYGLIVPSSVKHIGNYAFKGCVNLGGVMLEQGVENPSVLIDGFIVLKEGLESIGDHAFNGCTGMRSVTLPNSLKTLGSRAFYKCESLETVNFGIGIQEILPYTFYDCAAMKEINIPGNVKTIGKYAFRGVVDAQKIVLGEGVETVSEYAFTRCEGVRNLVIADSVKYIGNFAFRGMAKLQAVYLTENLVDIGRLAFYGSNEVTFYFTGSQIPETWNNRWNSAFRPVVLQAELSEDNDQIVSWTAIENGLLNLSAYVSLTAPTKDGYVCVGWSDVQGALEAQYAALNEVPAGTTVYPVWAQYVEAVPEMPEEGETPEQSETDNTGK